MALWGNKKSTELTGTVSINQNTVTITGSNTVFLTELSIGDFVVFEYSPTNIEKYQVVSITSNTVSMIKTPFVDSNATAFTVDVQEIPKYLEKKDADNTNLVTIEESRVNTNGAITPGWNTVVTYTSSEGIPRRKAEVLAVVRTSDL